MLTQPQHKELEMLQALVGEGASPPLRGLFQAQYITLPAPHRLPHPKLLPKPLKQSQGGQTFIWPSSFQSHPTLQYCCTDSIVFFQPEYLLPKVSLEQYLFLFPFPAVR